jgi:hypothetical protein
MRIIMKKIKGFSGIKKCSNGEVYVFKNGTATVPNFRMKSIPVKISIKDFKQLQENS